MASQGPNYPGLIEEEVFTRRPWVNDNNLMAADGQYTTSTRTTLGESNSTNQLYAKNFGLTPSGTIDGVQLEGSGYSNRANSWEGFSLIADLSDPVGSYNNFQLTGVMLYDGNLPTTPGIVGSSGGPSELHELIWTPEVFTEAGRFYVSYAGYFSSTLPQTIYLDFVRVTVYYTPSSPPPPPASPAIAADAGSFTLIGEPSATLVHRKLSADTGNYTNYGQEASLKVARSIIALPRGFSLFGKNSSSYKTRLHYGRSEFPIIDLDYPLDLDHHDNDKLVFALLNLPGLTGGRRWPDATGRTAGGTLVNGPTWGAGGLVFDGVNDELNTPSAGNLVFSSATFIMDVIFTSSKGYGGAMGCRSGGNNVVEMQQFSGRIGYTWGPSITYYNWSGGSLLQLNNRAYYAVTISPTEANTYVYNRVTGGVEIVNRVVSHSPMTAPLAPLLMNNAGGGGRQTSGTLFGAKLYHNRALSADEIARDYERSLRPWYENPTLRVIKGTTYSFPVIPKPITAPNIISAGKTQYVDNVDLDNLLDLDHPLLNGLTAAMVTVDGVTGNSRWHDFSGKTPGMPLNAAARLTGDGIVTNHSSGTMSSSTGMGGYSTGDYTILADCEIDSIPGSNHRFLSVDNRLSLSLRTSSNQLGLVREGLAWHSTGTSALANRKYDFALIKTGGNTTGVNMELRVDNEQALILSNTSLLLGSTFFGVGANTESASTGRSRTRNVMAFNRPLSVGEIAQYRDFMSMSTQDNPLIRKTKSKAYFIDKARVPTVITAKRSEPETYFDLDCPLDMDHPDNEKLVFALLNIPGMTGGSRWPDATGQTNGGTLVNGPTWEANGLTFDGSNDHVPLSNLPTTFSQITVLTTSRPNDASRRWIVADYPSSGTALSYGLRYQSGWVFNSDTLGQSASTTGTVGTLENVAGTYDGQRFRIYTGGQLRHTSFPTSGDMVRPAGGVPTVGRAGGFNGQYWNGLIGRLLIFNRALSADEIARDYERSLRPLNENPTLRKLSRTVYGFLPQQDIFLPSYARGWGVY